jgi:HK97 family phage major capsid protein
VTQNTIPTTADELEAMLDDGRVADLFEGGKPKPQFGEFVRNYAKAVRDKDASILDQVREQTQQILGEWLRENPTAKGVKRVNLNPEDAPTPARNTLYNKRAPGAKVDELGFDGPEDYLRAIWYRNSRPEALAIKDKLLSIQNTFGSTVPADGGFLIPETLRSELLRVALETAIVRPRARVIPMETLRVPFPTIDSTSNASSVHGGLIGYWTEEAGALTQSSAKFGRVVLDAKKLTGYAEIPNELFQDSILSFQAFLGQVFPEAISWFEDTAFFSGTGVGEPLGFLNADAAVSVSKESGQAAATIVWENVVKMYARMLPSSLGRAVWIVNNDAFPELATMALSVGTGGSAIWLNNGAQGPPMTILGRPVIFTEKAQTVGTVGDINFVDLGYYLIGDRQTMAAETSPHYKFANDQTAFRIIERVDGRPWIQSAITPQKGSNTLSPFVKLATRS